MLALSLLAGKKFINAFTPLFLPRERKRGEGRRREQNTAYIAIISSQQVSHTEERTKSGVHTGFRLPWEKQPRINLIYVTDVSYTWPYHDHIHSVPSFSHVFGDKRQYIYINIYQETIIMILYPRLKPENRCLNDVIILISPQHLSLVTQLLFCKVHRQLSSGFPPI